MAALTATTGIENLNRDQLKKHLVNKPELMSIPKVQEVMKSQGLTFQEVHLRRWEGEYCFFYASLNHPKGSLEQLENPHALSAFFHRKVVGEHSYDKPVLHALQYHPEIFRAGIFIPDDYDVAGDLNYELLGSLNGLYQLSLCDFSLAQKFVRKNVIETLLQRYFHMHIEDYCLQKETVEQKFVEQNKLLEGTRLAEILHSKDAELSEARNLAKQGDTSTTDQKIKKIALDLMVPIYRYRDPQFPLVYSYKRRPAYPREY